MAQEAHIVDTVVGLAVFAHQSGPVHRQHHMELQHGDVLQDLVVAPLQEGGVQRHHRHHALLGKAAGHGYRVFLCDAHVKGPLGIGFLEFRQAGAAGHGRGNGADPGILRCQGLQGLAEGVGEGHFFAAKALAGGGVEFSDAVEPGGIPFRGGIAAALFGDHMHQHRCFPVPGSPQQADEARQIVAVHRAQVLDAHVLENGGGQQETLDPVLDPLGDPVDCFAAGEAEHHIAVALLGTQIVFGSPQPVQVPGHAAHVPVDGHFVVVEDDDQRLLALRRVIQALVDHAAGGGTVAQQGDHIVVFVQQRSGPGHAQGDGHGGGGMTGHEGIGIAFTGLGEAGDAAELPQTAKIRLASGQQLMDIRLMTHVENQTVGYGIVYGFDGHRQLHGTQVGGQVAAGLGHMGHQEIPDLRAELGPLAVGEPDQVIVTVNIL